MGEHCEFRLLLGDESLVGLGIHELIGLLGTLLVDFDTDDPAAAVGVILGNLVDDGGLLLESGVGSSNLALDGGVDVAGRFDRLDGTNGVALINEIASGLGEFDVDDVTELLRGVFGNANDAGLAVCRQVNPFVVLGVSLSEGCTTLAY